MNKQVGVIVDLPAHSRVDQVLNYACNSSVAAGTLVRVPLGKKSVIGVVWEDADKGDGFACLPKNEKNFELKEIEQIFKQISPLSAGWRALVSFTAQYYQRSLGEVALQALPPALRQLDETQLQRRLKRMEKDFADFLASCENTPISDTHVLSTEQETVFAHIINSLTFSEGSVGRLAQGGEVKPPLVFLLHGATGSGKTEVYMRTAQHVLELNAQNQVLVLVPEINLTPQLEARFRQRFPAFQIVCMHSGMTAAQRLQAWLAAHSGQARIVLGTRMAVFASMPGLSLIVVDEEHDPSYKQYEGARWSARDLAVWRGWQERLPVILGSATPSLESWAHAQQGRYSLLEMPSRIGAGTMPKVRLVDMHQIPRSKLLAPSLVEAIQERLDREEQSLVLLNRRGYAPVLFCTSCGWQSQCPNCSAWRVFHRVDRTLRCHHCGLSEPVPRACPTCGDPDLQPIGRGTERLEEQMQATFKRPNGLPARVLRIDADSTRHAGKLTQYLEQVHQGDVDIVVGTQMVAKGHDFRRMTLVAAVNPDTALFSNDFRSGERLFALLLQAAGRAGRDAVMSGHSELWIQTDQPHHPLFTSLKIYDYSAFAQATLQEREMAAMPPFMHLALVRAEARTQEAAQLFLADIHAQGMALLENMGLSGQVALYPPIPAAMQRIANIERAQMLLESASRQALQRFLAAWRGMLHDVHVRGLVRWAIDIDPQSV